MDTEHTTTFAKNPLICPVFYTCEHPPVFRQRLAAREGTEYVAEGYDGGNQDGGNHDGGNHDAERRATLAGYEDGVRPDFAQEQPCQEPRLYF